MTKLNDTQLVLLSAAAQRDTGSLLPFPTSLTVPAAQTSKAIAALIKAGLAEQGEVGDRQLAWLEEEGDKLTGVRITDAGRAAIGLGDPAAEPTIEPPAPAPLPQSENRQSKAQLIIALMARAEGATLDELIAATGWLPHTTRAALTGVRKKGHAVERGKRGELTCYFVAAKAA